MGMVRVAHASRPAKMRAPQHEVFSIFMPHAEVHRSCDASKHAQPGSAL